MLKPSLVSIVALDGRSEDELLALVAGAVTGHDVVVGNEEQFAAVGLTVDALGDWPARLRQQGQRVVFVAVDGHTVGLLGVADTAS